VRVIKFPIVIGRRSECNLCIPNRNVSRSHAEIYTEGFFFKTYFIKDLGSKFGTTLVREGKTHKVPAEGMKLMNKDIIEIGDMLRLTVVI